MSEMVDGWCVETEDEMCDRMFMQGYDEGWEEGDRQYNELKAAYDEQLDDQTAYETEVDKAMTELEDEIDGLKSELDVAREDNETEEEAYRNGHDEGWEEALKGTTSYQVIREEVIKELNRENEE